MSSTAMAHRPFWTRPRSAAVVDVAVALGTLGGSLALLAHGDLPAMHRGARLDLLGGTLAALATLPLIAWRRAPFPIFLFTAAASVLGAAAGYSVGAALGPTAALYLLAASRDDEHPGTRGTAAAAVSLFLVHVAATIAAKGRLPATELTHVGIPWAAAWFAGERTRLRREHVAELEARVQRAERDAERERELAAAEERARIARDLHDAAGHAISVIAVRAGAARLRHDEDPERSRRALEEIERVARGTVAEIDEIVGALRDGGAPHGFVEAPPGLASLGALLERHASAGLDVTVDTRGAPRPLEGPVDVAAYRILQEALTNAARHGLGSAQVELVFHDSGLEVTVVNPAAGRSVSSERGHGLVGMRERATLLDGTLDTERVNGTFRLRARLPYGSRRA